MRECHFCSCPIHEEDGSLVWDEMGRAVCGPCDKTEEEWLEIEREDYLWELGKEDARNADR